MSCRRLGVSGFILWLIVGALPVATAAAAERRGPATQPSLLTPENYDKIRAGMTTNDVKGILGRNQSSAGSAGEWTLTWRNSGDRAHHIDVHFKNGVVTSKHETMDWPRPPAPDAPAGNAPAAPAPGTQPAASPIDVHLAQLRDRDPKRRHAALAWFGKADRDDARAAEVSRAIEPYLRDRDFAVRNDAARAIRTWGTRENSAYFIHVVTTAYDVRDATKIPDNMDLAIEMLVKLRDPDGVAPIARLMRKFFNRSQAVKALQELGPELAEPEVLKYVNDRDRDVALAAKEVLESFKTDPGVRLTKCLADLKNATTAEKRVFAAQEIAKIDVIPQRRKEVAAALEAMLSGKGRGEVLPALAKWGGPENEPALIKCLADPDPMMRQATCRTLGVMGTKQSLPALQKAATDHHPAVAAAANEAIQAISKRNTR